MESIPKKIHFCWLSDDDYPEKISNCIQTWKEKCPNYEIIKWDFSIFPHGKSCWVDKAFYAKKYAFAADYLRCYALYTEGGIYLDSDVEVLKSFDDLLDLPYFIGKENDGAVEAGIIGAKKGMDIFRLMMEHYDRKIVSLDGEIDTTPMPKILLSMLKNNYDIEYVNKPNQVKEENNKIYILPYKFFSPKSYKTGIIQLSDKTYTIHHFAASWHGRKELLYNKVKNIFGMKTASFCSKIWHLLYKKGKNKCK